MAAPVAKLLSDKWFELNPHLLDGQGDTPENAQETAGVEDPSEQDFTGSVRHSHSYQQIMQSMYLGSGRTTRQDRSYFDERGGDYAI